jgi:predicted nucleic acid-binding protein
MRIVVDTNIVFSALLNTNSRIARILLQPKTGFSFYCTEQLFTELEEHKARIKKFTAFTDSELNRTIFIITSRIRFINIPKYIYKIAEDLSKDIDIDDTEFIALTEHIKGKLWSGDKELITGLEKRNWNKIVTTQELIRKITKRSNT